MRFNYDPGGKPNEFILDVGETEYNVFDGKLFTIGKHNELIELIDNNTLVARIEALELEVAKLKE